MLILGSLLNHGENCGLQLKNNGCYSELVSPKIHVLLELQNMALFGNRVFAVIMKVKNETRAYWISVNPKSYAHVLIRDRK